MIIFVLKMIKWRYREGVGYFIIFYFMLIGVVLWVVGNKKYSLGKCVVIIFSRVTVKGDIREFK